MVFRRTMEEFLQNNNLGELFPVFQGLSDEEFYSLSNTQICEKLVHTNKFVEFIVPYDNIRKQTKEINSMEVEIGNENSQIEHESTSDRLHDSSTDFQPHSAQTLYETVLSAQPLNISNNSVANKSFTADTDHSEEFQFVENDLYTVLKSSVRGQIILGKYKRKKVLDESSLKQLVIYHKISDSRLTWKIKNTEFLELSRQIVELFPNQDPARIYIPPIEGTLAQSARGYLYNYYRVVRKELREAGLLAEADYDEHNKNESAASGTETDVTNSLCLTSPTRELYPIVQVTTKWQDIYDQRMISLNKREKRKKVVTLQLYFDSFPCLAPPLGKLLLEQDFDSYIKSLADQKLIPDDQETIASYSSKFTRVWPTFSKKIINKYRSLKVPELKEFFCEHKQLFEAGTHDSLLALFLISLGVKFARKIKIDCKFKVLTKKEITDSFILHVQDPSKRDETQRKLELWLTCLGQEIVPNVVVCGKLEDCTAFVCINKEFYPCPDVTRAIESCFKCLMALNTIPFVSEFAWSFIYKGVYGFNSRPVPAHVSKLLQELKDMELE